MDTSTTTETRSIHIANEPDGSYNVHKPLPYPFHVDLDGNVLRQEYWRGEPLKLLGFAASAEIHEIAILAEDWLHIPNHAASPTDPDGMYPVFLDEDGTIWQTSNPVTHISTYKAAAR